ncbi:hypothetical protein VKT23_008022 [Stygiomarasmius scandens]|uniref:Cytochrome P450 n=1 Tax=Marasmiellus scandens TaxID=2682957 RepID=A0ABR1JQ93_9AGAR
MSLFSCLPLRIQNWINDNLPSSRLAPVKETRRLALEVASDLVQSKIKELKDGEGKADLMSLFVKANMSQTEKNRMSEEEIYSQMRAIFIAGHETTANTIGWALLELCRNPEMQERLRKEIRKKEKEIQARGGDSFTVADLESIEYLSAVVKETLRFHPVSPVLYREAGSDDVIPLSNPIVSTKGEKIIEVPVPKGMKVTISVAAYNRTKELFGNDAHTFNPDRWLNQNQKLSQRMAGLNLYANLATFSAGVRSCIGWRFAVLEFQSFLVELINNFEFSLTKECEGLRREACLVMLPTIQGKVDQGPQLLLKVSVAGREQ